MGSTTFVPKAPEASATVSLSRRAFLRGRSAPAAARQGAGACKAAIGDACLASRGVECRVCGEICPEGAIRFRPTLGGISRPQLNTVSCNGCGDCVSPCPGGAIALMPETTEGVAA